MECGQVCDEYAIVHVAGACFALAEAEEKDGEVCVTDRVVPIARYYFVECRPLTLHLAFEELLL